MRIDEEDCNEEQVPVQRSFCRTLTSHSHWKCLTLSLLISGSVTAIACCRLTSAVRADDDRRRPESVATTPPYAPHPPPRPPTPVADRVVPASPCTDPYLYIPIALITMLYLVYLVECWHSRTRLELGSQVDVASVYRHVRAMRRADPVVWWKAVCYHYVRRTRHVTRYRNGDVITTTQVYYDRHNSHVASSCFDYTGCGVRDATKRLAGLERYPLIRIRFTTGFSFTGFDAEREFERQRSEFFAIYERLDDYMETREGLDLMMEGDDLVRLHNSHNNHNNNQNNYNNRHQQVLLACQDPEKPPWYVTPTAFWIASLLLASWPLRVLIGYRTAYVNYHVHKMFGTNYVTSPDSGSYRDRMSRVSSSELEMCIRNNYYTMVPSYSEALLMDSGATGGRQTNYGAMTSPDDVTGIPLVHLGNSICVRRDVISPDTTSGAPSGDSGGGSRRRHRRRRKRKRRRQSYTDAILGDNESSDVRQQGIPSTPESGLSDSPTLATSGGESSCGILDSDGAERLSAGHVTSANQDRTQKPTSGSPLGSPPAYELALAMRSAVVVAASAAPPSGACMSIVRHLDSHQVTRCLAANRSRMSDYELTIADNPRISGLMETTL